ncbi:hypothetical protein LTR05_000993 [Lithohypha guttulata]|uniref:Short chain dehydrogenase n=1 Tax=Lithohypha guttulata TaxID=1690604 RepID=A0AAN7T8B8_9EURO|nr:hypothetical protein LTR05_000993 [Lithohypha guttulata]
MAASSTIVLITGANSGIGLATSGVIASASDKYHVIMASRNIENGEKALEEVGSMPDIKGELSSIQLDVNDPESISRAANEVQQKFGRLDVLVNNAGRGFNEMNQETLQSTFLTNATGPVLVSEAFKPLLLKSQDPRSIYVSSGLGSLSIASDKKHKDYAIDYVPYRMSKAALDMWVIQEAKQMDGKLKVFAMCPGLVVSNLRGTSDEARNAGGYAGSPLVSGETILSIVEGKRDADVGRFVHKDGVYEW